MSPPATLSRSQSLCGVVRHQPPIPVAITYVIRVVEPWVERPEFGRDTGSQSLGSVPLPGPMDAPWKPRCSQISTAPAGFRRRRTRRACWPRCVKGVTKLEVAGYTASAYVLHPTDWEGVELALSSTNAIEHLSLPYDPATRPAVRRPGDHQQRAGGPPRTRNRNGSSRFGHR